MSYDETNNMQNLIDEMALDYDKKSGLASTNNINNQEIQQDNISNSTNSSNGGEISIDE